MSSLMRLLLRRGMSSKTTSKTTTSINKTSTDTDKPASTTEQSASGLAKDEVALMVEETKTRIRKTTNDFYRDPVTKDIYLNPNLSPPPRTPQLPEDFRHPHKLGHWVSYGFDWTSPIADKYMMHEAMAVFIIAMGWAWFIWLYTPDYKLVNWAQREAFIRMHKREALGLPLINRDFVDPGRIVLPPEEELKNFPINI